MQKLLKRTAQAEKQVARRKALRKNINKRAEEQQDFRKRMQALTEANRALATARRSRREDYELGPLAPRRDTPVKDVNGAYWGSISLNRSMSELGWKQRELACKWAGGLKHLCVKVGDRVAIMQGPDKGKIGRVRVIDETQGVFVVDGDHLQQNVTVSDFLAEAGLAKEDTFTQLTALRVPIQAVRLVHPLRDPETGTVRDVIINELQPRNIIRDKPTGRVTWHRVVPGLNIEIPWPRAFEDAERNELEQRVADHPCDTLRIDVEEQTFVPSLLKPPMPVEIVDELRNKYSKFRTRHEPEYIARKEEEAAAKIAARKKAMTMQTPLKELNAKIREDKKALGQPVLSDAMLEKIGEFMFRAQQTGQGVKPAVKTNGHETKESMATSSSADGVRIEVRTKQPVTQEGKSQSKTPEDRFKYMSKKGKARYLARLEALAKAKAALQSPANGLPTPEPASEATAPPPS